MTLIRLNNTIKNTRKRILSGLPAQLKKSDERQNYCDAGRPFFKKEGNMKMITDAYAERKHRETMQDTWGHLAPKIGRSYNGYMIWAYGGYGDIVLLDAAFKNLSDSPWLYEAMQEYIGENLNGEGVYKWKGQVSKFDDDCFCFGGKTEKLDFKDIFSEEDDG